MFWQRLVYNKKNRQDCVDKLNVATFVLAVCTLVIKIMTLGVLIYRDYNYNASIVNQTSATP